MSSPAFQFYPADYLADMRVRMLSWASRGLYLDLICYCWREGWIPADIQAIRSITGFQGDAEIVAAMALFCPHPTDSTKLIHKRLEDEMDKQAKNRAVRAEAGSAGGRKRAERMAEAKLQGDHARDEWDEMLAFFGACVRCGEASEIAKDHIVPIYQGGSNHITNIQPLCPSCNSSKGPESTDHRPAFCQANSKQMPSKWLPNHEAKRSSSSSSSTSVQHSKSEPAKAKSKADPLLLDEAWLDGLQANSAYAGVNVRVELGKAHVWCEVNHRQCTKRFFTNWLNRAFADNRTIAHAKPNPGAAPQSPHNNNLNRGAVSDYRKIGQRVSLAVVPDGQGNPAGGGGTPGHAE